MVGDGVSTDMPPAEKKYKYAVVSVEPPNVNGNWILLNEEKRKWDLNFKWEWE